MCVCVCACVRASDQGASLAALDTDIKRVLDQQTQSQDLARDLKHCLENAED